MILILTSEAGDYSHIKLVDWLDNIGASYKILTGESLLRSENTLLISNGEVFLDGVDLKKEVSCVFFRRWFTSSNFLLESEDQLLKHLKRNIFYEIQEVKNYLFEHLRDKIWIPKLDHVSVNKLSVLEHAKKCGLLVPQYTVTNSKKEALAFFNQCNENVISKAIGNFQPIQLDDYFIGSMYTKKVSRKLLESLPDFFCLSLFQKNIYKSLEYRALFFYGKLYTVGILSQEQSLTKLDSRISTEGTESRLVPAKFDLTTTSQIENLMKRLDLNIGCLDFIQSTKGDIYFLEVNPVGQFGGYSERCALNFEKDIAEFLNNTDIEYGKSDKNKNQQSSF